MTGRRLSGADRLEAGLASVGLALADGEHGRRFVAHRQGDAIVLTPRRVEASAVGADLFALSALRRFGFRRTLFLRPEGLRRLEEAVAEELGEPVSIVGLRLGSGSLSKLVVGFANGLRALAIAKIPLTDRAVDSVATEVETLEHLGQFDRLAGHLPQLTSNMTLGGKVGMLMTAGPTTLVRRPAEAVSSFLAALHEVTARTLTIHESGISESWIESLEDLEPKLSGSRSSTLEAAIQIVHDRLGHAVLDHTIAHGDFTRWNIRKGDQGLFVFDWEAAISPALPYHDLYHFFSADSALLNRPAPASRLGSRRMEALTREISPAWTAHRYDLYLAYLIQTVFWYGRSRDWSAAQEGPFWRFLWAQLSKGIARA